LFVSNSQVIGCEDCLRNDLYCVGWGVKLCSILYSAPRHYLTVLVCVVWMVQLWNSLQPDVALTERISPQWTVIGFQGSDPATDFRGMGLLGLLNLVWASD